MDSATLAVEIFYDASAIIFTTCADFVSLDLKKEWGEILQNSEVTITSRTDTELFEIRAGVGTSVKKQAKNSPSPLSEQIIKNGRRRKILCYHAHLRVLNSIPCKANAFCRGSPLILLKLQKNIKSKPLPENPVAGDALDL